MRLATLRMAGAPRAVVVTEDGAVPVGEFGDVGALLRAPDGLEIARRAAGHPGRPRKFDERDLMHPVLAPGAVVCVGLNYRSHILETGGEVPEKPTLFSKLPRALTGPFADVLLPRASGRLDYEAEVAIVIGRAGRYVERSRAWDHVAGLTLINDVSARDLQRRTPQWFAGKTLQESTPVGPWIVTLDQLGDVTGCELWLTVNGEQRQRATLGDLVFDIPDLVSDLSQIVELEPGDIIATGTPGGVGASDGRFLADGDVVEVASDRLGRLRTVFRAAAGDRQNDRR